MTQPIDIINREIKGDFFHRFSIGDTVELKFSNCILTTQHINFDGDSEIVDNLSKMFPYVDQSVDASDTGIALALSSCMRLEVVSTELDSYGALSIIFTSGLTLCFPTHTKTVDWHWALQKEDCDPYLDVIIGAFENGSIKTNKANKSQ